MTLREQLETSLAITPDTPQQAALKMRAIREWCEIEDALAKALKFAKRRNGPVLHHWLDVAACKFLGIQGDIDMASTRATVAESDTSTLIAELTRRAKDERDLAAIQALKLSPTRKKEKAR